jgi:hypothetical protein
MGDRRRRGRWGRGQDSQAFDAAGLVAGDVEPGAGVDERGVPALQHAVGVPEPLPQRVERVPLVVGRPRAGGGEGEERSEGHDANRHRGPEGGGAGGLSLLPRFAVLAGVNGRKGKWSRRFSFFLFWWRSAQLSSAGGEKEKGRKLGAVGSTQLQRGPAPQVHGPMWTGRSESKNGRRTPGSNRPTTTVRNMEFLTGYRTPHTFFSARTMFNNASLNYQKNN